MKPSLLISFCLVLLLQTAYAAEDPHAGHKGMGQKSIPAEAAPAEHKNMKQDMKGMDHSLTKGMDRGMHKGMKPAAQYGPDIPEPTDEERAVAFPDLGDMDLRTMMDTPLLSYSLLDQFEWVDTNEGSALRWEAMGWIGKDKHRLWWRTEGVRNSEETEKSELQLLYGQPFARWWDWVAGVRHDFRPGPSQTWLAAGVQGLAPYWFETEATFFLGEHGQTNLRLEIEYELLLTNKLILQPLVELNFFGKDDIEHGVGSGLAEAEAGLRLRYEIKREFAPYIGVTWERAYGETADFARLAGEAVDDTALVAGIRLWY